MKKRQNYRSHSNNSKYNDENNVISGEFYDAEKEPSLTRPDEALSVREILARFTRGGEVKQLQPQHLPDDFDEGLETLDLNQLDKMERLELLHRTRQEVKEVQTTMINKRKKREAKLKADADQLEIDKKTLKPDLPKSDKKDEPKV